MVWRPWRRDLEEDWEPVLLAVAQRVALKAFALFRRRVHLVTDDAVVSMPAARRIDLGVLGAMGQLSPSLSALWLIINLIGDFVAISKGDDQLLSQSETWKIGLLRNPRFGLLF